MWFLLVIIAIWFGLGYLVGAAAWIVGLVIGIPLGLILVATRCGEDLASLVRHKEDFFMCRMLAFQKGHGLPFTRRNTIEALDIWAMKRRWFGDVAHESEDIAWAKEMRARLIAASEGKAS